jgi:hypothetical protein
MTRLERAARAMNEALPLDSGNAGYDDATLIPVVRAVLTAIRDHPPETDRVTRQHGYSGDLDLVWKDMIDAALAEEG